MKTARDWLQDPTLFSTSAVILLVDAWGVEFLDWDPATVEMELGTTFGIAPTPEILDRINAAVSLFNSNLFFLSLETFSAVCSALNFGVVSSEVFLPADLDDVLWGVSESRVLLGEMATETDFSHNVARYVGQLLAQEGIDEPPAILAFAEVDTRRSGIDSAAFVDEVEAQVYYADQTDKKEGLESENNARLLSLFQQITRLPLRHGNLEPIKDRLSAAMRSAD
jgi:hypothetical protein